jgi:hypothetical protein
MAAVALAAITLRAKLACLQAHHHGTLSITTVAVALVNITHQVKPVLPPPTVPVMHFLTVVAPVLVVFIPPATAAFLIDLDLCPCGLYIRCSPLKAKALIVFSLSFVPGKIPLHLC